MASNGVVEHSAKGDTVYRAGMQPKPDDPTSVLIHDDRYPVSPQHCRFAAKEVRAPETVLDVTEESRPGRTAGVRLGLVMSGQDASNNVFIDGVAERQSNLLSDSRAAPEGIALLGSDDRVNEFFGGTLGTGLALAFRGEKQAVLALGQDLVKVQKGRRLQSDGQTEQPGRPHKQSAPTGDDAIRQAKIGSALARAIEDQQLMFDENGLGNYGTDAAGARKSGDGREEMDEKGSRDRAFPHRSKKPKTRGIPGQLAIRHGHVTGINAKPRVM